VQHREKHLRDHEIATILKAASVITDTSNPGRAMRRWVPWLLAYTGARPGEITQLRGQDVKQIDGIWCLNLTPEAGTIKTGKARRVPIHPHLIEQGFLEFVKGRSGPLFYRPREKQQDPTDLLNQKKSPAAQAREQLSIWIRKIGIDDLALRPNHAWRHTFKPRGPMMCQVGRQCADESLVKPVGTFIKCNDIVSISGS
jgi:integrase